MQTAFKFVVTKEKSKNHTLHDSIGCIDISTNSRNYRRCHSCKIGSEIFKSGITCNAIQ